MSRQDKATTERHARTLRELVKRPENKVCADCKRNDPRWASWNIGVFVCIRCSGIHRSMGTHISKVKSVDLDTWTPEQMISVMKWGNSRANAYWEAHLKAGHIPPEHKIESFIRSKYESKRWALEGPVPDDPSVFDNEEGNAAPVAVQEAAPASTSIPPTRPNAVTPAQAAAPVRTSGVTSAQPQGRQLLSSTVAGRAAVPAQAPAAAVHAPAAPAAPAPQDDLFTLDFHAPPTSPTNGSVNNGSQKKDVKQDILSLFSAAPATSAPGSTSFGAFGGAPIQTGAQMSGAQASPWDSFGAGSAQQSQPAQPQSFMGTTGAGMWGASSGWNAPAAPAQPNVWASTSAAPTQAQQQNSLFNTSSVWGVTPSGGAPGPAADPFASFGTSTITTQKKDDAFGDIWGSFK